MNHNQNHTSENQSHGASSGTKEQILRTVSGVHEAYETYEECKANAQVAVAIDEALRTGCTRGLRGAIVDRFAPASPEIVAWEGLLDGARGEDNSGKVAKQQACGAAVVIGGAVLSASAAGAGALTGYAGIASAVSTLGAGSATTALASAVGLTAASGAPLVGAAATTALVSAVGGPVVAAGLVVASVSAVGFGVYKAANWIGRLGSKLIG